VKPKHTFRGVVLRHAPHPAPAAASRLNLPTRGGAGPARVRVGREVAGRAGKGVSVISGLPLDAAGLAQLATRLKKFCGAGGAVKNGVIEIQGEHRERLVSELLRLGYAAKLSGG
jgi:translation initiation factor 1